MCHVSYRGAVVGDTFAFAVGHMLQKLPVDSGTLFSACALGENFFETNGLPF